MPIDEVHGIAAFAFRLARNSALRPSSCSWSARSSMRMICSVSALSAPGVLADERSSGIASSTSFEACRLIVAHLLHLRLEAAHLEQRDGLGGLVHLVDGIVQRADQVLDIGAVERRDEGAAHRDQHLPGDFVGLILAPKICLRQCSTASPPFSRPRSASAPATTMRGVLLKEVKEPVLLGHDRLEPAEHGALASGIGYARGYHAGRAATRLQWRQNPHAGPAAGSAA